MSALQSFAGRFWQITPPTVLLGVTMLQFPEQRLLLVGGCVVLGLALVEFLAYGYWWISRQWSEDKA